MYTFSVNPKAAAKSFAAFLSFSISMVSALFIHCCPAQAQATPAKVPSYIAAFQTADAKQMPPSGAVLFTGSSSIALWTTLTQDFPEIPVIDRGVGGFQISDCIQWADYLVMPYKPKIVVFYAGTNDLDYGNKTPEQVFSDYVTFVTKVHAALPDTRIVYISINPTVSRWKEISNELKANYLIENYTLTNNSPQDKLSYIDSASRVLGPDGRPQPALLRSDGLHFNADGYKLWTSIVKPQVLALAKADGVQFNNP